MDYLSKLIDLKEKKRSLWDMNCWSSKWFNKEQENQDNQLRKEIAEIELKGIFCKCQECGTQNDTVDFTSETPNKMICEQCSDELRIHIKDKCGLI